MNEAARPAETTRSGDPRSPRHGTGTEVAAFFAFLWIFVLWLAPNTSEQIGVGSGLHSLRVTFGLSEWFGVEAFRTSTETPWHHAITGWGVDGGGAVLALALTLPVLHLIRHRATWAERLRKWVDVRIVVR